MAIDDYCYYTYGKDRIYRFKPLIWWWRNHRIPRELRSISKGDTKHTLYIIGWVRKVIPNFDDMLRSHGCDSY